MADLAKSDSTTVGLSQPEWDRLAEEYRSTITMIQDTGNHIWVINGAYLVVMGILATPYLGASSSFTPKDLIMRGFIGLVLAVLWLASFQRNYAFYNMRIRLARSLEGRLGFIMFDLGDKLGRLGAVAIPGQDAVAMPWIGKIGSMQTLTATFIGLFLLGFGLSFIVGICRALAT